MILIIDNYDSFVHNLARYLRQLCDEEIRVERNDRINVDEVQQVQPSAIVVSPGPCRPVDSGNTLKIIKTAMKSTPILGVCLGHQAIIESLGGEIVIADKPTHGKPDQIFHALDHPLFREIPSPFSAGRYHSLMANPNRIPSDLKVIAQNSDNIVMAVAHRTKPVVGVQFHPESVLTDYGYRLLHNFLTIASIKSKLESIKVTV